MDQHIYLVGDVGLLGFDDPAVPFAHAAAELARADILFGNLECVLSEPPRFPGVTVRDEPIPPGAGAETRVGGRQRLGGWDARFSFLDQDGLFAPPLLGEALLIAGFDAVGCANNQTYGAEQILASLRRLDELGIGHTGAGSNWEGARAPVVVEQSGLRVGFLQYTSVYWPSNHEAGVNYPGVATIKGYTAYQQITEYPIGNRPGIPPLIITWADQHHLDAMADDIRRLREDVDLVVTSHHWGFLDDVMAYQEQIAHASIDAGADIVIGHGPHQPLAIEVRRGRPIFYGLGNFAFRTRHWRSDKGAVDAGVKGKQAWAGLLVDVTVTEGNITGASFRLSTHNDDFQTLIQAPADAADLIAKIVEKSRSYGTRMVDDGDRMRVELA